jgi:hypothetical protein
MGGKLQAVSSLQAGATGTVADKEEIITTKEQGRPDLNITIDRPAGAR